MDERVSFEARLADAFGRYADLAPVAVDGAIGPSAIAAGRRRRLTMPWPQTRRSVAWATLALLLLALLAALAVGALVNRHDRLPGAFSQTGPSQIHGIEAAALLADGRVLVTGMNGWAADSSSIAAPVELFDPRTSSFTPTGAMAAPRYQVTATTLRDGRVLVAGGAWTPPGGGETSVATAELYDPRTGSFTRTGNLITPRSGHTATLLADGRVLVLGGMTSTNVDSMYIYSAEIYDPGTGVWTAAGSMREHRSLYAATLLLDGRVLVAGGWDEEGNDLRSVELFDPASNTFRTGGELTGHRRSPRPRSCRTAGCSSPGARAGTQPTRRPRCTTRRRARPGRPAR